MDSMSPWYTMALAPPTQPRGLIGAGAATAVEAKLDNWEEYLALVYFCVLATASYLVMELYGVFRPEQMREFLARLRGVDRFPHRPAHRLAIARRRLLARRQEPVLGRHSMMCTSAGAGQRQPPDEVHNVWMTAVHLHCADE